MLLSTTPFNTEFLVNVTVPNDQQFSSNSDRSFAVTPEGSLFVAWTQTATSQTESTAIQPLEQVAGPSVMARMVDSQGNPQGNEISVSTTPCESAGSPVAGAAGNSGFVVVWESVGNPLDPSGSGVFARLIGPDGTPQGNEFRINQTTLGDQSDPTVAWLSPTRFAVAWAGAGTGDDQGVFARVFDSSGAPLTDELALATTTTGVQHEPALVSLPNVGFEVAWSGAGAGDTSGVFARPFNFAGQPLAEPFRVNSTTTGAQQSPAIARNGSGSIVWIAWQSDGNSEDLSGWGIELRQFTSTGAPLTNELLVNQTTEGNQQDPVVVGFTEETFVVAWNGNGPGDDDGIFLREISATGNPLTNEFRANISAAGSQRYPALRPHRGTYSIAWSGNGIGDDSGVFIPGIAAGDTTLPVVAAQLANDTGSSPNDRITSDPAVNGTAVDNLAVLTLVVVVEGPTPGTGNITDLLQPGGTFTLTRARLAQIVGNTLADGDYRLRFTASDAAGNTSQVADVILTLDTSIVAPTVALANDTGSSSNDRLTSDPTIAGTAADTNGIAALEAAFDTGGLLAFQNITGKLVNGSYVLGSSDLAGIFGGPLADGVYTLDVRIRDTAGNVSTSIALTFIAFTLDTNVLLPTLALVNDTGTSSTDRITSDPTISGNAADPNGIAQIEAAVNTGVGTPIFHDITASLAGNVYTLSAADLTTLLGAPLGDGDSTLLVRARDNAGNLSGAATLSFTLDRGIAAPTIGLANDTGESGSDLVTSDPTIIGVAADPGGIAALEAAFDDGINAPVFVDVTNTLLGSTYTLAPADLDALFGSPLVDATYTLLVRSRDNAGNASSAAGLTFTLLTTDSGTTLVEGSAFDVTRVQSVTVPVQPSNLVLRFDSLVFDTTSQGTIKDAFEVAFVDAGNRSLVQTIGLGQSAFFNISEGQLPNLASGVSLNNGTVTLSLAGLQPGMTGTLIFRLVNNDRDQTTQVHLNDIRFQNSTNTSPPVSSHTAPGRAAVPTIDFTSLSVVTTSFAAQYAQTTFDDEGETLFADVRLQNAGTYPVHTPLVAVIEHISDPSIFVIDPDGFTPEGAPYFDFSRLSVSPTVTPGSATGFRTIAFHDVKHRQFTYDLKVLGQLNRAPSITSQPVTEALTGFPYVYQATATDADNDLLTFTLLTGPAGMAVDPASGLVTWTPQPGDLGNQDLLLEVTDGHGGVTQQSYTIATIAAAPNRPPLFTSTPMIEAFVNTPYIYRATASDPDYDPLSFTLTSGPAGMEIDAATGLVSWQPMGNQTGTQSVVLSVDDGNGGTASQAYQMVSRAEPGNTSPVIISQPVLRFDVPRFPNPASGDVNPASLNLDLGVGDSVTRTVSLTLPAAPPVTPPPHQTFPLTLGSTVSGAISASFAQDDYTFTLAAPALLYFDSLTNSSGLAWTLVGPADTAVSSRPLNSAENSNPVLNLTAGDYTLTVVGLDEAQASYQFRLSDLAQAGAIALGTPLSSTLDPANETDLYRFTAAAGDRFYFDAQTRSGATNAIWRLVDPFGNNIFNQVFNTSELVDVVTLPRPGLYTLLLEGSIADTGTGTYTINAQPVTPISQALNLGDLVNGSIAAAGEEDPYTFSLATPSLLYFDALTSIPSPRWTLTGPAGTAVSFQPFSTGSDRVLNLPAGDYTLTLDRVSDTTGAYQFRLSDLASAAIPTLTPGTPQSSALNPGNETDLYRITASAGDRLFFDSQGISPHSSDPFVRIRENLPKNLKSPAYSRCLMR
ncbi:MAG: Ig-like domain-containing protein [Planctomycetales bacterium]